MLKNKESKIKILENFYAIDYIMFGKPLKEIKDTCCPMVLDEYVTTKGALLSVLMDMYKITDYNPQPIQEKLNFEKLVESAIISADLAKDSCKKVIMTEKGREFIKREVKTMLAEGEQSDKNINEVVDSTISKAMKSISVDTLLVRDTILESENVEKLNEWEGRILEDAYKTLKADLIDLAETITESEIETKKEKKVVTESKQKTNSKEKKSKTKKSK